MNALAATLRPDIGKRRRELVTPEGLALPLTIASRSARAGALLLDLTLIFVTFFVIAILLGMMGLSMIDVEDDKVSPAVAVIIVMLILVVFLSRYAYFLFFELGPRGATPGKRGLGIRVAARGGGRLTAEAVIARNLMRDVEVFVPIVFLLSGGVDWSTTGIAALVWLAVFVLFPFFNRDHLRAGDLVAGTWVVEAERHYLMKAMSVAPERVAPVYRFGEAELSVYGEHELQVLERVLRQDNAQAQRQVMEAICRKIGWQPGDGDERAFLDAFYAALRARLEQNMRFGKRKKDKFDGRE